MNDAHPFAPSTSRRFEQNWKADLGRFCFKFFEGLVVLLYSQAQLVRLVFQPMLCIGFASHLVYGIGVWTYENNILFAQSFCKIGIFTQKSIARMYGICFQKF
jgi:hypothetical protein